MYITTSSNNSDKTKCYIGGKQIYISEKEQRLRLIITLDGRQVQQLKITSPKPEYPGTV